MTQHLFIYGTLAPNRPNHHIMTPITGTWTPASTKGRLIAEGWGASMGYPALIADEAGEVIEGFVFSSDELESHWARLDEFEGDGYERVLIKATLATGETLEAFVYAINQSDKTDFLNQSF